MNEENNNFNISFEDGNGNNEDEPIYNSNDMVAPGNIIGDQTNEIVEQNNDEIPEIMINDEMVQGPIIVNSEEGEDRPDEQYVEENEKSSTESFKNLEEELERLKNEKDDIDIKIANLNKRKEELDILIKSKQEELDYKKEVEITTDRLKTYIKDLEVNPGAVRDALAALMNNMNN
jgi:chromosome segregation ATPase